MREAESDAIRAHLAKILASGGFAKADRLCRFLRFTVEAKLTGEEGQIKEYVLGREVFDRNGNYDPRVDPIVRVEARRLRTKLEEYYSAAGRADALRIEFPKGSYVPVIHPADGAGTEIGQARTFQWRGIALWISGLALLLAAMALGYRLLRPPTTSEMVAVAPAGWLWGEPADARAMEEGLAERISIELANQRAARVVGWPLMLRYRTGRQEFRQMAAGVGAAEMLLIQEKESGVAVFLLEAASGEKLWVGEYSRKTNAPLDNQLDLARAIVADFVAKRKDLAAPRSKIERSKIEQ
jgi:serine/threonine-protein kinase